MNVNSEVTYLVLGELSPGQLGPTVRGPIFLEPVGALETIERHKEIP